MPTICKLALPSARWARAKRAITAKWRKPALPRFTKSAKCAAFQGLGFCRLLPVRDDMSHRACTYCACFLFAMACLAPLAVSRGDDEIGVKVPPGFTVSKYADDTLAHDI